MADIGKLSLQVTANATGLNAGLSQAEKRIAGFAAKAQQPNLLTGKKLTDAAVGPMEAAGTNWAQMGAALGQIHPMLGGLALLTNPIALGMAAIGTETAYAVTQFSAFEDASIVFGVMLGSTEQATAYLKDLQQIAARTPFEFKDLTAGTQRMIAMGFSAEEAKAAILPLGNIAAAMPGDMAEGFASTTLAIGEIKTRGTVQARQMMMLTQAGIPAWKALADYMGLAGDEGMRTVKKMSEAGQISADVGIKALLALGESEKFAGMMEKRSQGISGLWSTVKDVWNIFQIGIGESIVKGSGLHDILRQITVAIEALGASEGFKRAVGDAAGTLGEAAKLAGETVKLFKDIKGEFDRLDVKWGAGGIGVTARDLLRGPGMDVAQLSLNQAKAAMNLYGLGDVAQTRVGSLVLGQARNALDLLGVFDKAQGVRISSSRKTATALAQEAAAKKVADANVMAEAHNKKAIETWGEMNEKVKTFGMSAEENAIFKATEKGAAPEVLGTMRATANELKYLNEVAKLGGAWPVLGMMEEVESRSRLLNHLYKEGLITLSGKDRGLAVLGEDLAKRQFEMGANLVKAAASPVDKMMASLTDLEALRGKWSWLDGAAIDKGMVDAFETLEKSAKLGTAGLPSAMMEGSKEALSFIAKREARGAESVQQRIERVLEDSKRVHEESRNYEREAAAVLKDILRKQQAVIPAQF